MEFFSRWIGGASAPRRVSSRIANNDSQTRLARFKRLYNSILEICNRPRDISNEWPLLQQLASLFDRLASLLREETRAPAPHLCLHFASSSQLYAAVARAAAISHNERVIDSAVAVLAALVDSDEESFLSSPPFAKSLMRLVTRVADTGGVLIGVETETAIFELLFTISAKIRLQPEILPVWFRRTVRKDAEDVFRSQEKNDFVGLTQKADFPLCYLLIDRVHHEGRIGDFARTGLLYIFEATGRSAALAEWVVLSDLPTLMASGLGALYSQLSRELSILHPDATLPAVLAMSDYSTTNPRPVAETAFSETHKGHMTTFLSYLAFWQDVLDHCRSKDVQQTLLDHFQILFVQQLLYPSVLQSSDTDAGSSVAVLTYLNAMLESLDYPDIIQSMLTYLLDMRKDPSAFVLPEPEPPRSPTTVRRRESLMLLTAPRNPEDVVEPSLFNLVDLVVNSIGSSNNQTAFSAMKLLSTMMAKQKKFTFGTIIKVERVRPSTPPRTVGALEIEVTKYMDLATTLHGTQDIAVSATYSGLTDDARYVVEGQLPPESLGSPDTTASMPAVNIFSISHEDALLRTLRGRLRNFLTNSVDVNLALTEAIVAMATCVQLRLDNWLVLDPAKYTFEKFHVSSSKSWRDQLDEDENAAWFALQNALKRPAWPEDHGPLIYNTLQLLCTELEYIRERVPNFAQLMAGRQSMLEAASFDRAHDRLQSRPSSLMSSPTWTSYLDVPRKAQGHNKSSSASSIGREYKATKNAAASSSSPLVPSAAASPVLLRPSDIDTTSPLTAYSVYQPPPPDTPSTTDILMQKITLPATEDDQCQDSVEADHAERCASLNHVLTNVIVLQEFVLELVAVLQVRAAVLGEYEVCCV
ncbi:hypothetical protein M433DRAFT_194213 [Acidomyces richmondensis BFW]|nr:MAG: hypothetical protein FE78DRAFT_352263 [Acidomyces sp. 'richmondensis']KYG50010.1 hypothetical protein M433DRAFT_194213 [Acidomyces richmondensis BFW]